MAQGILFALFGYALYLVGRRAELGTYYWYALGLVAVLVAWQFRLARGRDRDGCFKAFLHNHWVGATVFAGIALDLALRGT